MLRLESLNGYYGSVQVLHDVTLSASAGEVLAVLGRNGAGKTSLLKAVMGLLPRREGSILLRDDDLSRHAPHQIPAAGIAYVPQGRGLFAAMSVRENLEMGLQVHGSGAHVLDWTLELFPELRGRLKQESGTLSGGQQQMLAMARALCTEPSVLLLDEPSEGLQPSLVDTVLATVALLKQENVASVLVEQKVAAALHVADRVAFLDNGRVAAEKTPDEIAADATIINRYVGVARD